jgi:hypothetical protein
MTVLGENHGRSIEAMRYECRLMLTQRTKRIPAMLKLSISRQQASSFLEVSAETNVHCVGGNNKTGLSEHGL